MYDEDRYIPSICLFPILVVQQCVLTKMTYSTYIAHRMGTWVNKNATYVRGRPYNLRVQTRKFDKITGHQTIFNIRQTSEKTNET